MSYPSPFLTFFLTSNLHPTPPHSTPVTFFGAFFFEWMCPESPEAPWYVHYIALRFDTTHTKKHAQHTQGSIN